MYAKKRVASAEMMSYGEMESYMEVANNAWELIETTFVLRTT